MRAMIAGLVMSLILVIGGAAAQATESVSVAYVAPDTVSEEYEWEEYRSLAYGEYSDEFTRLFESYETRWSRNGRLMIRQGSSGSFRFAKRTF